MMIDQSIRDLEGDIAEALMLLPLRLDSREAGLRLTRAWARVLALADELGIDLGETESRRGAS